jgi:outer membrane receptor protein involved in Fe transport
MEGGLSYQRTLEGYQINNEAAYLSWQPQRASLDVKAEYDRNHLGHGYWIEAAHSPQQFVVAPNFFRHMQLVGRMEQFFVRNGGGNGVARVNEQRPEVGLNYQIRDDWRLESSYGRLFSAPSNSNTWNFGFTYRFVWPLWPGKRS